MKRVLSLGLLASVAACPLFAADIDLSPTITEGTALTSSEFENEYSDFISLFYDRIDYDRRYGVAPFCGATILNPTHLLTAAHCLYENGNLATSDRLLFMSAARAEKKSDFPLNVTDRIMVKNYYVHENYQDGEAALWKNDIAILELESALNIDSINDVVTPIADQTSYQNSANTFIAIGHGDQATATASGDQILGAEIIYRTDAQCQSYTPGLTSNQRCFDGQDMGALKKGVCQGDSGGPIYWNDAGVMKQVGIASFGPTPCGYDGAPLVVVTTEVSDYSAWISDVLNGNKGATFTATDAARNAKLGIGSSTSSSGGGGLPLWSLFSLFGLAILRKRR